MNSLHEIPTAGFLTPAWVKKRYSISNSTLYSWCALGVLPPMHRVGPRAMRFLALDIARFEQERLAASTKQTQGGESD